ncbi:MAG: hypothetical protein HPY61_14730 [Methanotrichaceae archaeon]|nr:hypothetical protein [Methanotrichaceae archaeon]
MQVTCPTCRALADRTYDNLFRRTNCPHCGYELVEINVKDALKAAEIREKEMERELEEKLRQEIEASRERYREYREHWLEQSAGVSTPMWCRPIPEEKIPPEGYWRVPGTLREWLQILEVKDIDEAVKKVRKAGPFNRWQEIAWDLWRKGEI